MEPDREIEATLCVAKKDFEFDSVTEALGIEPSDQWVQKHDHLKGTDLDYKSWQLSTGKVDSDSVSLVVEDLLVKVQGKEQVLKSLTESGFALTVVCSITIFKERPVYDLSKEAVAKIAEIGADFSMDLYDFSTND